MRNASEVVFVIDESSSMIGSQAQTLSSFNEFLDGERNKNKECRISILKFSDPGKAKYIREAQDVRTIQRLSENEYRPDGITSLLDACGKAIEDLGSRLDAMPEAERPDKVVVAVVTDGQENASIKWTLPVLSAKIKEQQEKYNWQFMFLGVGLDQFSASRVTGQGFGMNIPIPTSSPVTQKNFSYGLQLMGQKIADYTTTGRASVLNYSGAEKTSLTS